MDPGSGDLGEIVYSGLPGNTVGMATMVDMSEASKPKSGLWAQIGTKIVKPISQYEFLTDKLAGYDTELHMSHEMQKLVNDALVVMPIESVDALLAYSRSEPEFYGHT